MKIYYRDTVTGKTHWTNPKSHSVQKVNWLGREVIAIIAYRKNDELIIPAWCVAPESRHLLTEAKEVNVH